MAEIDPTPAPSYDQAEQADQPPATGTRTAVIDYETAITLQPGQPGEGLGYNVRKPLPYPLFVDRDGYTENVPGFALAGRAGRREDLPKLIGFQEGEVQTVVLFREDFLVDPSAAVGLCPVFAAEGSMFALTVPITEATATRL